MSDSKTRSGDQSHDHQAVFNVIACLQCVVPEVEGLRELAANTDQQKQERAELKKVSPHFIFRSVPIPREERVRPASLYQRSSGELMAWKMRQRVGCGHRTTGGRTCSTE